jgi:hypothetical protein
MDVFGNDSVCEHRDKLHQLNTKINAAAELGTVEGHGNAVVTDTLSTKTPDQRAVCIPGITGHILHWITDRYS